MEIYMNELTTESPYEFHKDLKFIKEIDHGAFGKVIHAQEVKKNLDFFLQKILISINFSREIYAKAYYFFCR